MFGAMVGLSGATAELARESYAEFAPFQPDRPSRRLERRYTDDASAFVDVDGARIHYRDEGPRDGPVLVAIHGMYSSLHTWDGWVEALADRVRIVRFDLPGFGLTGPNEQGIYRMPYYVEALASLLDALDIERASVAGNSLGGGIAWRFAAEYPDRTDRLLLLDSIGRQVVPDGAELLVKPGVSLMPRYLTPRSAFRGILADAYGDPTKLTAARIRRYHDLLCRAGNRRAVLRLLRAAEPGELDPAAVSCPTLLQWGGRDTWLPPSLGRSLAAEIPDADFRLYDGVGHIPMEEAPEATVGDAAAFLT